MEIGFVGHKMDNLVAKSCKPLLWTARHACSTNQPASSTRATHSLSEIAVNLFLAKIAHMNLASDKLMNSAD
jgi:hypothetical protein